MSYKSIFIHSILPGANAAIRGVDCDKCISYI